MRTAIFPGSFDPFTVGHADIIERMLPLFDQIVIAVGFNIHKQGTISPAERVATIQRLYQNEERVRVVSYNDLTVDLAKREEAEYIIRGIRNVKDLEFERDIAQVNRELTGIETVLVFSDPRLAHISSSMVRELRAFGKDVTPYLP